MSASFTQVPSTPPSPIYRLSSLGIIESRLLAVDRRILESPVRSFLLDLCLFLSYDVDLSVKIRARERWDLWVYGFTKSFDAFPNNYWEILMGMDSIFDHKSIAFARATTLNVAHFFVNVIKSLLP